MSGLRWQSNSGRVSTVLLSAIAGALAAIIVTSYARQNPGELPGLQQGTVAASSFVLMGPDGSPRGALRVEDDGSPTLQLWRRDRKDMVRITVAPEGPTMVMLDKKGHVKIGIGYNDDGSSIVLTDPDDTHTSMWTVVTSASGLSGHRLVNREMGPLLWSVPSR